MELSEHREVDYEYQITVTTFIFGVRRVKNIFETLHKKSFFELSTSEPYSTKKKAMFFNSFSLQFGTRTS